MSTPRKRRVIGDEWECLSCYSRWDIVHDETSRWKWCPFCGVHWVGTVERPKRDVWPKISSYDHGSVWVIEGLDTHLKWECVRVFDGRYSAQFVLDYLRALRAGVYEYISKSVWTEYRVKIVRGAGYAYYRTDRDFRSIGAAHSHHYISGAWR
jgi:hypothetical protein